MAKRKPAAKKTAAKKTAPTETTIDAADYVAAHGAEPKPLQVGTWQFLTPKPPIVWQWQESTYETAVSELVVKSKSNIGPGKYKLLP